MGHYGGSRLMADRSSGCLTDPEIGLAHHVPVPVGAAIRQAEPAGVLPKYNWACFPPFLRWAPAWREREVLDSESLETVLKPMPWLITRAEFLWTALTGITSGQSMPPNTQTLIQACIQQGVPRLEHDSSIHLCTRLPET